MGLVSETEVNPQKHSELRSTHVSIPNTVTYTALSAEGLKEIWW